MFDKTLAGAIRACLDSHTPFAVILPPGVDGDTIFMCDNGDSDIALRSDRRFFAVDFARPYAEADVVCDRLTVEQAIELKPVEKVESTISHTTTSREEYLDAIARIVARLRADGGKTVIARTISSEARIDVVAATECYFAANPTSFRCLCYTPANGCWLIATPELLLRVDKNDLRYTTFSLAGTRPHTDDSEDAAWDGKNIEEQAIVSRYIDNVLTSYGCAPDTIDKHTKVANRVEHLCTVFSGRVNGVDDYAELVNLLSPTPALAGYPRETALNEIAATESVPRGLYGGYVGIDSPQDIQAWVTIRCCKLDAEGYTIYTGSGITPESTPEDEWQETNLKASALKSILEQNSL